MSIAKETACENSDALLESRLDLLRRVALFLKEDPSVLDVQQVLDSHPFYLEAVRDGVRTSYLPLEISQVLKMANLEQLQAKAASRGSSRLILAICDSSSNIVTYEVVPEFAEKKN